MHFITFVAVAAAAVVAAYKFVPTFRTWADSLYAKVSSKLTARAA